MPPNASFDRDALARLLRRQHRVVTREQALACGMSPRQVEYRTRAGGPWQRLLTGVYLAGADAATHDQRAMAGLLHAGPRSVLTASAALRRYGLTPLTDHVDVLVPLHSRPRDARFVRVHRTDRMPRLFCVAGQIRYALVSRAVADTVRGLPDLIAVRAVVAEAVQRGMCSVAWLTEELAVGPVRGSAGLRKVLAEVADGVRSSAEADLRDLIVWAGLPMPMFNPRLFEGRTFIATPDCWWPDAGVAAEVDSRAWHLSPKDWEATLARHARITAYGINVLHFTPRQVKADRKGVAVILRRALAAGRPLPHIRAVPAQ